VQHPILTGHEGGAQGASDVQAGQAAWSEIAEGYRRALEVRALSPDDRDRFRRCLRRAERLAGQRSVRLVQ
jgi:hypothetical protein